MINKMKKILIIILFIFIFIFAMSQVFAYDIPVTKDNLTEAFNLYAQGFSGGYILPDGSFGGASFGASTPIQVTDNQLIDTNNSEITYYVDYSLGDTLTFSVEEEINSNTNLDTISDILDSLEKPILGLLGVSITQGVSVPIANHYYGDAKRDINPIRADSYSIVNINNQLIISIDNESKTFNDDNFDVTELVTFLFNDEKVVEDEEYGLYTYTLTTTQTSQDNYTIKAELEIGKNSDFSQLIVSENPNDSNNSNNNNNNNNNDNNIPSISINNNNNNSNSILNNGSNSTRDNTVSYQTLPKTGITTIVFVLIILSIILTIVFGIKNQKYKDIK